MDVDPDVILGRKAVAKGYVSDEEMRSCLKERDVDRFAGRPQRFLGKIMVERGLLSFVQLVELLKAEEVPAQPPAAHPPVMPALSDEARSAVGSEANRSPGAGSSRSGFIPRESGVPATPPAHPAASIPSPAARVAPTAAAAPARPSPPPPPAAATSVPPAIPAPAPPPAAPPSPLEATFILPATPPQPPAPAPPPVAPPSPLEATLILPAAPPQPPAPAPPPAAPPSPLEATVILPATPPQPPAPAPPPVAPPSPLEATLILPAAPPQPPAPTAPPAPGTPPPAAAAPASPLEATLILPVSPASAVAPADRAAAAAESRPAGLTPQPDPAYQVSTLLLDASTARPPAPPPPSAATPPATTAQPVPQESADDAGDSAGSGIQMQTMLLRLPPSARRPGTPPPTVDAGSSPKTSDTTAPAPAVTESSPTIIHSPGPEVSDASPTLIHAPAPAVTDASPTIVHAAPPSPAGQAARPDTAPAPEAPDLPLPPADRVGEKVAQRLAEKSVQPGLAPPPGRKAVGISSSQFKVLFSKQAGGGGSSTFGRYQLISELARGSMGIVYRAFDPELKRTVALKVMLPGEETTEENKARFQREALLAARLHHPNIVQVYDVGEAEGKLFYTMHLVEGSSLQQILNHMGKVPQGVALTIVRDSARAVHHAHEHRLVHRDLKPANLLITSQGAVGPKLRSVADTTLSIRGVRTSAFRVLVSDFGIAKDINSQTLLTQAGTVLGTPAYMAPEQAAGLQEKIGPATDTYALGVVLYQLLTGATPFFDPDPIKLLADIIQTDPAPPRKHAPDLHPDLETIILKAIEKDPRRRYPTALALAEDIDRFLVGEMIQARRRSWLYQRWRWALQHRGWAATVAAMMLLAAGTSFRYTLWPRLQEARRTRVEQAERLRRQADAGTRLARAEATLASGKDTRGAIDAARDLVSDYEAAMRAGEDLPVAAAHALLARALSREGDSHLALRERYRAWRAALGRPEEGGMLLGLARDLLELRRFEAAGVLLDRTLSRTDDPRVQAEALHLRGRAAEGGMAFAGAAGWYVRALAREELTPESRADVQSRLAFCRAFAREIPLAFTTDAQAPVVVDLDGKPGPEVIGTRGTRLFWGRLGPAGVAPTGGADLDPSAAFPVSALSVERLHDAEGPTLLAGGGDEEAGAGRIWLVRPEGDTLRAVASVEVDGRPLPARRADLDGDRRPEILVAVRSARPHVAVLAWDPGARALTVTACLPISGDPVAVEPLDVDEDGRDEFAVFLASGPARGITVFRWDAETREAAPLHGTAIGSPIGIARLDRPGRPPGFLVGSGWDRAGARRRRATLGSPRFEELTPPPGAYLLQPVDDGTFLRKPLAVFDWSETDEGHARAQRVDSAFGSLFWCALLDHDPRATASAGQAAGALFVVRADDLQRPFAVLQPRTGSSRVRLDADFSAADLDGDGAEEFLVSTAGGWIALGADPRAGEGAGAVRAPASTDAGAMSRARTSPTPDAWLDFAAAAEEAGFPEEAADAYREAFSSPAAGTRIREAALAGQLRCLAAGGQVQEVIARAERAAEDSAPEAARALGEAMRLLEQRRRWSDAARLGRLLLSRAGLEATARDLLARRVEELQALAEMRQRWRLVGADAVPLDWLADSPFAARRHEDGSWTIFASRAEPARIVVPIAPGAGSWRLEGTLAARRGDAGASFRIGAGPGTPGPSFVLESEEDGSLLTARLSAFRSGPRLRLAEFAPIASTALPFEVGWIAHQDRLYGRFTPDPGIPPAEGELPVDARAAAPTFAGIEARLDGAGDAWGLVRLERLEFQGAREGTRPVPFTPVDAIDHLRLAHGRWIQGRLDEALALYTRAERLGDLERAKEETARAEGLPSAWDRFPAHHPTPWAAIDARFHRGLLLALRGDPTGAQAGLREAWEISRDRVVHLLRRDALALQERPYEAATLRDFWTWAGGAVDAEGLRRWAQQTLDEIGPEAVEILVEGAAVDVVTHPGVGAVHPDSGAARCGLRPSDVVLRVDDTPVASDAELRSALLSASEAGREKVVLELARNGRVERVVAPAGDLGVETFPVRTRKLRLP